MILMKGDVYNYKMTEFILIRSVLKNGEPYFQVCKEGLMFLRQFRSKKLRVVFNVTHTSESLNPFCMNLVTNSPQSSPTPSLSSYSELRVSQAFSELSNECILICLNAYENGKMPSDSINYVVLGYLLASIFFYHNHTPMTQQSPLSLMLSALHRYLTPTNLAKLEQQIKYKSGFAKKPFFMCLMHEQSGQIEDPRAYFRQFYKYQQGNKSQFNRSVDALMDYFPQRSSVQFSTPNIKKLKSQLIKDVLGRQIFNFQVTGHTIENLCFELCQAYNSQTSKIDLVLVYQKIIQNQKKNVKDRAFSFYEQLAKKLIEQIPKSQIELKILHEDITLHVLSQSFKDACTCMDLNEYQPILQQILAFFQKNWKKLQSKNQQQNINKINKLYETLTDGFDLDFQMTNTQQIEPTFNIIKQKLQLFVDQSIEDYSKKDLLIRLMGLWLDPLSENIQNTFQRYNQQLENNKTTIEEQEREITILQYKNRQLQQEYSYMLLMNEELKKLKVEDRSNISNDFDMFTSNTEIMALKKKIRDLEDEIEDQNIKIQDLGSILEKFDSDFDKKNKHKFSKDTQSLLSEIKNKMNGFYPLFEELKKVQGFYNNMIKDFEEKKKTFDEERIKEKKQKQLIEAKLKTIVEEKKQLQILIGDNKQIINEMNQTAQLYKDAINKLQNQCALVNGQIGDTQDLLEYYQKSLSLVGECLQSGKFDSLKKFIKMVEDEQLKDLLVCIVKK